MALRIIGCANGSGGRYEGCDKAAQTMRQSPFLQCSKLTHQWLETIDEHPTGKHLDALPGLVDVCNRLATSVSRELASGNDLVVIGGDHSCAIGTWSGVANARRQQGSVGLIWVDAHLDVHTPKSSDTGNIHGMPVAHLLGYGDQQLRTLLDKEAKIKPENLAYIGSRSFESPEKQLVESQSVRIFAQEECDQRPIGEILNEAIAIASKNTTGFGMSIDLDGFRVEDAPAVGTPESGGIVASEFIEALKKADLSKLIALEISEFMPHLDDSAHKSEQLVVQLIEAVYAHKYSLCN